ncbi:unnamed protein product [Macrosiphum euphorbiae]|uniref:CCHC-type domain-containing protein n=1 Tax=Macrosiphum euphorbiae TaxID=13131 RepID=A0AAV0X719_9HEMI|nr:unnamed protein product [Macrosiphum euphorbiae]
MKKPRTRKHDAAEVNAKLPPPPRPPRPPRGQTLKRVRAKPDAVLIKAVKADGDDPTTSYATIAARLKEKVDLTSMGVTIERTRMTKAGNLLLEVGGKQPAPIALSDAITAAIGNLGEASVLQQKVAVEFRGVDVTANEDDVRNALRARSGEEPFRIGKMRRSPGGQKQVDALLSLRVAEALLFEGRMKIGWSTCKVRLKERSSRCYRCQGFGHYAANCTGPDRTKTCMRCGEDGHIAVRCNKTPSCPLCRDNGFKIDHISGGEACDSRKNKKH